jgi:hypothetical protein
MPTDETPHTHDLYAVDQGLRDHLTARPWARHLPTRGPSLHALYEMLVNLLNGERGRCRVCTTTANGELTSVPYRHQAAVITIGAHVCARMAARAELPHRLGEAFATPVLSRLIVEARASTDVDQPDRVYELALLLLDDPDNLYPRLLKAISETVFGLSDYYAAYARP